MKVLCFGSLNLDHTYRVHHLLQPGETNRALSYDMVPGGKGANQALAMARAGAKVFMAGCIGSDGQILKAFLQENCVDTTQILETDAPTGHAVIQVDDNGENCILVYPGANTKLTQQQIDKTIEQFKEGDILLTQNETNLVDTLLQKAKRRGMITVLNPSPVTESLKETLPLAAIDWLILNEAELFALSGKSEREAAIAQIQSRNPACKLIVTLGKDGAIYCKNKEVVYQRAYEVQAIDTTAAGDTFTGYFFEIYYKTQDPQTALSYAAAAAALAVTQRGAAESIPCLEETEAFLHDSGS